jgi:hypothetical protein
MILQELIKICAIQKLIKMCAILLKLNATLNPHRTEHDYATAITTIPTIDSTVTSNTLIYSTQLPIQEQRFCWQDHRDAWHSACFTHETKVASINSFGLR